MRNASQKKIPAKLVFFLLSRKKSVLHVQSFLGGRGELIRHSSYYYYYFLLFS